MSIDNVLSLLDTAALRTPALGAALLGMVAGLVGSFAVLRRQSLQGDMISHAALPGVAVAFLIGGRAPLDLILGGAVAGWLAMFCVGIVKRNSRVPFDAALGGALAVFFGLGLALITYVKRNVPAASQHPLERYLFGQAAFLRDSDLQAIAILGTVSFAILIAFWKELKLISFDPEYAASLGVPVRRLDLLITTLTVIAVVIGLKAVGVVLMTALLIAPAVAARQWSNKLGRMVLLAGLFGAAAGAAGTIASHLLSYLPGVSSVPTGPTIVLSVTLLVLISIAIAPARGLVWESIRRKRLAQVDDRPG